MGPHGYGILKYHFAAIYYGQFKEKIKEGYGYFKLSDNSTIYGQWKDNKPIGEVIWTYGKTERIERKLFERVGNDI